MAFAGVLNDADIAAALEACKGKMAWAARSLTHRLPLKHVFITFPYFHTAADSFNHKDFFAKVGLSAKSGDDVKKAFAIIDQDKSGFIEEDELK